MQEDFLHEWCCLLSPKWFVLFTNRNAFKQLKFRRNSNQLRTHRPKRWTKAPDAPLFWFFCYLHPKFQNYFTNSPRTNTQISRERETLPGKPRQSHLLRACGKGENLWWQQPMTRKWNASAPVRRFCPSPRSVSLTNSSQEATNPEKRFTCKLLQQTEMGWSSLCLNSPFPEPKLKILRSFFLKFFNLDIAQYTNSQLTHQGETCPQQPQIWKVVHRGG